MEANLLISNNHLNDKIIHLIIVKSYVDGKKFFKNFDNDKKIKSIIIELKFLCLNWKKYNEILKIFKKNNLEILNMYCTSFINHFFILIILTKK